MGFQPKHDLPDELDIWGLPDIIPPPPEPPPEPRFVNVWFEEIHRATPNDSHTEDRHSPASSVSLDPEKPLIRDRRYYLCIGIGRYQEKSIIDWEARGRTKKAQLEKRDTELEELRKKLEKERIKFEELTAKKQSLEGERDTEREENKAIIAALQAQIEGAESRVQHLETQVKSLEAHLGEREARTGQSEDQGQDNYDFRAIRKLIVSGFEVKGLKRLCKDHKLLRPTVAKFPEPGSLEDVTETLIDFCRRYMLIPELLEALKKENPRQYKRHEAEIFGDQENGIGQNRQDPGKYERHAGERFQHRAQPERKLEPRRSPVRARSIKEPPETKQREQADLYVGVLSDDFDIAQKTQILTLPPQRDSEPVRFDLQPLRLTFGIKDLLALDLSLYYKYYRVQQFQIQVEVRARVEDDAETSPALLAQWRFDRTAGYSDLEKAKLRRSILSIHRQRNHVYQLTLASMPSAEESSVQDEFSLEFQAVLSEGEMAHLATKARRMLYSAVRAYDLLQDQNIRAQRRVIGALAQIGRQLYQRLFRTEDAKAAAKWMAENLPLGSTLQIADHTGSFRFPWSLVYGVPPGEDEEPIDLEHFWGWRYQLAMLTDELLDTYEELGEQIDTSHSIKILVGMYRLLIGAREQERFFRWLEDTVTPNVTINTMETRRQAAEAFDNADQHLLYFFCHSHTECPAVDVQLDPDLMELLDRLTREDRFEQDKPMIHDRLDDRFDVSDSWLRLTRGKLTLTWLEDTVASRFKNHPLVFLNSCQTTQVQFPMSTGLVPFFIERGARAVIGIECSMTTVFSDQFGRDFLTRFLQGETVGEIMLGLRRQYLLEGNPLALAYTLYGSTDVRLSELVLPTTQVPAQHNE